MENNLKNIILNKYTNIYKKYFENKKLKYSQIFQINDTQKYMTYRIILDPGFGITLVFDDGDIRIMDYLLACEFYNYGVSFNYTYLGYIMLLGEKEYTLNIYDKFSDSFYEEPTEQSLIFLNDFLNIFSNIIEKYNADIFISEDTKILDLYINGNKIEKEEIYFDDIAHGGFLATSFFDYKFKTCDDLYLIDLFNIEIPIYSEKRSKLVNPYYLSIFNSKTKEKKFYILDEEELNIYDTVLEILSLNQLGKKTYITNPLLYEVLQDNKKDYDNIEFLYESLDYSRYLEYLASFETIYNAFNDNVDVEQLKIIISDIEECDKFLWQYFENELDETLLQTLNPHYFDIYNKYIKTMNFDSDSPFLDNLFSFQFFSTLQEKDFDRFQYDKYYIDNNKNYEATKEENKDESLYYKQIKDDSDEFIN